MLPATDAFRPAAKTATNTTRPSPTISAAEVVAVRPGLRIAFSRASRPGTANRRSIGRPITEATGRTNQRADSATPMNTSTAPPAIAPIRAVAGPEPNSPASSAASPARHTTPAIHGAQRRRRRDGGSAPGQRGHGRHARGAQRGDERGEQRHADADDAGRRRSCASRAPGALRGIPKPAASNSAPMAAAKPSPAAMPSTDATAPMSSASPADGGDELPARSRPASAAARTPARAGRR